MAKALLGHVVLDHRAGTAGLVAATQAVELRRLRERVAALEAELASCRGERDDLAHRLAAALTADSMKDELVLTDDLAPAPALA